MTRLSCFALEIEMNIDARECRFLLFIFHIGSCRIGTSGNSARAIHEHQLSFGKYLSCRHQKGQRQFHISLQFLGFQFLGRYSIKFVSHSYK
jgi:hypothetical protein